MTTAINPASHNSQRRIGAIPRVLTARSRLIL
jgi:hypothetical protein